MNNKKLKKCNELSLKIKEVQEQIHGCENQTCEWISFAYGNGSSRSTVTNNPNIIEKVKAVILAELHKELTVLNETYEAL